MRLAAQHLTERLRMESMLDAAGACAVRNSPPGSALLALHARVEGMTRERLDRAAGRGEDPAADVVHAGAPFYFPTARRRRIHDPDVLSGKAEHLARLRGATSGRLEFDDFRRRPPGSPARAEEG